ncbi:DMT family transporter [Brevibacterium sp. UCMA 11754]|uniref:DMT family transporter n=1 Tax=Brevibacterium sp. UCMA 11754 TaxID=2749198 RepID=UPI002E1D5345
MMFFPSVALRCIEVGIGYAVWTGIGTVGAAALGPMFFDGTLTRPKAFLARSDHLRGCVAPIL